MVSKVLGDNLSVPPISRFCPPMLGIPGRDDPLYRGMRELLLSCLQSLGAQENLFALKFHSALFCNLLETTSD